MPQLPPDEAITRARASLGLAAEVPGRAWRTERLDRPGEAYYLVIFGDEKAAVAVATVDTTNGEIRTSAHLPGVAPHLTVDAEQALQLAGRNALSQPVLVWQPCRASRSPFYPLWRVRTNVGIVYVDQQGVVWPELVPGGPGG
jgi:hypothetical protein